MKVRCLRGVCVGIERHLAPGDTDDLEPALVNYLVNIGAVEIVPDDPVVEPAAQLEAPTKRKRKEPSEEIPTP
jgi:hypothetical protein